MRRAASLVLVLAVGSCTQLNAPDASRIPKPVVPPLDCDTVDLCSDEACALTPLCTDPFVEEAEAVSMPGKQVTIGSFGGSIEGSDLIAYESGHLSVRLPPVLDSPPQAYVLPSGVGEAVFHTEAGRATSVVFADEQALRFEPE